MSDLERYYEPVDRRARYASLVLGGLLIVLGLGGAYGCRARRIESCRERGGTPMVPAWFSDEPYDVRCLEATDD
jgi:hypothetical protein